MTRQELTLLAVLLALSSVLHLTRLSEPRRVVFDEVHFGGFVNAYCCTGSYFFDIHPPHGKLLIAGVARLGGYRGGQAFEEIGEPITELSPSLVRGLPALAGTLLPLVFFLLMRQLGGSAPAAFLGGLAVALDNALLVQTRVVALDGILLLATLGALVCFLVAQQSEARLRQTLFSVAAGALAGLAAGTKFTGLAALGLVGVCLVVDLLRRPDLARLRTTSSQAIWILTGAVSVYAAGWLLHFALLPEPGPGYRFGQPSGQTLLDVVDVHRSMLLANVGLRETHPSSSAWWSWPLMLRAIFYWARGDAVIYFLGNPVLWWATSFGLLLVPATLVLVRTTKLELAGGASPWPRRLWVPALGYAISFVPLIAVQRPLFLYHYLTPLLFSLAAVLLWLDHVGWTRPGGWWSQRVSVHAAVVALILGFAAIAPLTYSFVRAPTYQNLLFTLLPGWR